MIKSEQPTRLTDFDRTEWHDVARILRPDWTDEQFDAAWEEFVEMKQRRRLQ